MTAKKLNVKQKDNNYSFPISEEFLKDQIKFVDGIHSRALATMNELLRYDREYGGKIYVGRKTLAERVGIKSTRQIGRITESLHSIVFILSTK